MEKNENIAKNDQNDQDDQDVEHVEHFLVWISLTVIFFTNIFIVQFEGQIHVYFVIVMVFVCIIVVVLGPCD